ncbi:DUF262 domain-containing HNH endonuclease family protein [uncultured Chryseobacterium sp.]|uniref:DUF262 domain-containing protein n=1 Tax=uncultured Chryseobacterium sp. TaxID=259322 RepID=UPI0025F98D1C|nr:DUF262 domain-containing HNH endonuclease family protein [uncultured Chryseobacterium sp.]
MRELLTLDDIYNKKIYRIPDYQRGYAWNKPQLIDFWEDLVSLNKNRFHYTGVISIKSVPDDVSTNWNDENWLMKSRGFKVYYVVDGQQRMTTISIFIQCLIEQIRSFKSNQNLDDEDIYLGSYNLKEIVEKFMVVSQPPHKITKTYLFGYEVDNPSFEFLRHKIYNEGFSTTITETYYTLNLENAKDFFNDNLINLKKEKGESIFQEIFEKLTQKLMFNLYEIGDDFDVFVAFETMNNRGKKLSNLELLKNRLIYLTSLYSDDEVKDSDRVIVRNKINTAWKEIYYQLGRNKKNPLNDDDFLRAHWILYFKYSRKRGDDYINFLLNDYFNPKKVLEKIPIKYDKIIDIVETRESDNVDEDADDDNTDDFIPTLTTHLKITAIDDYVKSIMESAKHWYNTFNPQTNTDYTKEESKAVDRLNRIGIGYFRPLLMASFYNSKIIPDQRTKLINAIERFIFLAFRISRAQSNFRNSVYYNATRELATDITSSEKIIKNLENDLSWIKDVDGNLRISPFKDFIYRKFISGTGFYGWNGLKYFLFEYEDHLMISRGVPKVSWNNFIKNEKDKVSIEHIYPQTATNECWSSAFENLEDERKKLLTNMLGNLLLLSQSINSSLQNICFADKVRTLQDNNGSIIRNGYANGSYSEQNVASIPSWNATQIETRSLQLLSFLEKRWNITIGDEGKKKEMLLLQEEVKN